MREQDMRERVDRFIQKHLRSRVLPAAFGVGVGLTGACATQSSSAGPPTNPAATATPTATPAPEQEQDDPPDLPYDDPIYSAPIKCPECRK